MESIIYLRTSTEEQTPENQLQDVYTISTKGCLILTDKESAWKDSKRPYFNLLLKKIKSKQVNDLYVWDLDRIYRNRKKLIGFFEICKLYNCKVHSFRQTWLEELNNLPDPFNDIMHSLMLNLMGWLAEEESDKKSKRIKASLTYKGGVAYSKKGNKWGRKQISTFKKNKIKELYNLKKSIRMISRELNLSIGAVHKTIQEIKKEKGVKMRIH